MSLFPARENLVPALFLLSTIASCALTPDPNLVALVPPGPQILAGISKTRPRNHHGRFLLITRNCVLDLEDFLSLSGNDPSREIHQVLLAALSGDRTASEEHGVLIAGRFDQARLNRSALDQGAATTEYRGFRVLEIQPLSRERHIGQTRWLAALPPNVLLFGTIPLVKQELDQHLAPGRQDSRLMRNLAALRSDDDAWSIVLRAKNVGIREALLALSPELASMADGKILRLGIRYALEIEFEYAIDPSAEDDNGTLNPAQAAPVLSEPGSFSLLPRSKMNAARQGREHGTIKVSPQLYDRWIDQVCRRENQKRMGEP